MAKAETAKETESGKEKEKAYALRVLVIRHGIAEEQAASDAERELTGEGRRKMRKAARGIVRLVPRLNALATSPLIRAVQTAEIVARRYEKGGEPIRVTPLAGLAPRKPYSTLMQWLAEHASRRTVAIVGHEPSLSEFASWSMTGLRESVIELKKGAACLLEFEREVRSGRGKLLWALAPAQLRAIR